MSSIKNCVLLLFIGLSATAWGQTPKIYEQPQEQFVRWHSLEVNKSLSVSVNQVDDTEVPRWLKWMSTAPDTTKQHFASALGIVSLEADQDHHDDADKACDYTFTLEVIHFDLNFNKTIDTIQLQVQHDPAAKLDKILNKDVKLYYNTAYLKVSVLSIYDNLASQSITDPNNNLSLKGRIEVERYYDFDKAFKCPTGWDVASTLAHNATYNTLVVTRPTCSDDFDATEWELEWTYIDNFYHHSSINESPTTVDSFELSASELAYDFNKNATRVRLPMSQSGYAISNVFEEGYVLIRMRYLGRKGSDFDQYYEGNWYPATANDTIDTYPANLRIKITNSLTHENAQKTWQYVASYAEYGKNKEVVSYYDGLNKNRQAVTRLSTDTLTVAGETIYDHQGRPAVQILPVPVDDKGKLQYYDGINKSKATSNPYAAVDFDNVNNSAEPLDTTVLGASQYYSSENGFSGTHQDYIPNAQGYPFTQTVFTKDGTGRVRKQSGVGPDHKIGSGHEIKYFYSKPSQEMLVRLFGTEVGKVEHYKESIVIDANGQTSVSYIDQHGRVIATSLAGRVPDNLDQLDSQIDTANAESLIRDLHNMNLPRIAEASPVTYELTYPFYAYDTADYTFWYEFQPEAYVLNCNNICFDCHYKLTVTITNEEGDTIHHEDTLVQPTASNDLINAQQGKLKLWTGSDLSTSGFELKDMKGKYTVHKRLELDETVFEDYWNLYLKSDTSCLLPFDDFLDDAYQYAIDCDSFYMPRQDDSLHAQCRQLYEDMLKDISPGGQYGAYELNGKYFGPAGELTQTRYETHYAEVSVYDADNILQTDYNKSVSWPTWENPMRPYKDAADSVSYVYNPTSGQLVLPQSLGSAEFETFIKNWQPQWAESLVEFHPEYGAYDVCLTFEATLHFDDKLLETESYQDAVDSGYISASIADTILKNDPLYLAAVDSIANPPNVLNYNAIKLDFDGILSQRYSYNGVTYTIKEFAAMVACAQINQDGTNCQNTKNFGDPNLSDEWLNLQWEAYRAAYMGKKRKLFEDFVEDFASVESYDLVKYVYDQTGFTSSHSPTSTGAELFEDKQVRFMRSSDTMGFDMYGSDYDAINTATVDTINSKMAAWKTSRCSSYIQLWINELSQCDMTAANMDSIIAGFLEVCQAGYDENNIFGASTVTSPTVPRGYTSFNDVLTTVLGSSKAGNNYCNHLLISMPPPYNHPFKPGDALKKGDIDCACELLQSVGEEIAEETLTTSECLEWEEYPATSYAEGIAHLLNNLKDNGKLGNNKGTFFDLDGNAYDSFTTYLQPYLTNTSTDIFQAEVSVSNGNLIVYLRKKTDHSVSQTIVLYDYSIAFSGITFSNVIPVRNSGLSAPVQRFEVTATPTSGSPTVLKGYAPGLEHLLYAIPGSKKCVKKSKTKSAIVTEVLSSSSFDMTEEEFYSLLYSCKNRGYSTDFYDHARDDSLFCDANGGYLSQPEAYCDEYPYIDPIEKWYTLLMDEMAHHDGSASEPDFTTDERNHGCNESPPNYDFLPEYFTSYRPVLEAEYYQYNNFWEVDSGYEPSYVKMNYYLWGGFIGADCDPIDVEQCFIALGALSQAVKDTFSKSGNTVDKIDSVFNYRYDQRLNKYLVDVIDNLGNKYTLETYNCRQEYCDNPAYTYHEMDLDGKTYGANCKDSKKIPLQRFLNSLVTGSATDHLSTTKVGVAGSNGYSDACNSIYRTSALSIHDYIALNTPMAESPMGDTLLARLGDTNQVPAYFTFYMTDTTILDWDEITSFKHLDHDTAKLAAAIKNGTSTYGATFYFTVWAFKGPNDSVLIKGHNTSYSMGECFQVSNPNVTEDINLPLSVRRACPSCLSCDTIAQAVTDFYGIYTQVGHNHQNHDEMLTRYLNKRYGNNWYSHEYQSFF